MSLDVVRYNGQVGDVVVGRVVEVSTSTLRSSSSSSSSSSSMDRSEIGGKFHEL